MTFGGAKVVHYRAIELASRHKMPLLIGPMENTEQEGTFVNFDEGQEKMYEKVGLLSLNSFQKVLKLSGAAASPAVFINQFLNLLKDNQIAEPQILSSQSFDGKQELFITGPDEILNAVEERLGAVQNLKISSGLSLVTATCTGSTSPELSSIVLNSLEESGIPVLNYWLSALSLFAIVPQANRETALRTLHALIRV
jgi:aspartokinase